MEDLYKILGVERGIDQNGLKKAYHKLAQQYHPDKNPGNKAAEEKFKSISNAYDILSDATKKAAYDSMGFTSNPTNGSTYGSGHTHAQYGAHPFAGQFHHGFSGPGFDNTFHDIFDDVFGRGNAKPQVYQNQHINLNYQITLTEAFHGKEVELSYSFKQKHNQKLRLTIPRGIESGVKIRFAGKGDDSLKGVQPGDLYVKIEILQDKKFKRVDNLTLLTKQTITYIDAMLGCICELSTIDGSTIQMEVPPNVSPGTMLKVAKKGMQLTSGSRGDLLVELQIISPALTENQRSILTKIQNDLKLKTG